MTRLSCTALLNSQHFSQIFSLFNFLVWALFPLAIYQFRAKIGHGFWSSTPRYLCPAKKFLFRKFLMTPLHVICGLPSFPNKKSWLRLWPVPNVTFQTTTHSMHHNQVSESLKKTKKTKNYQQSSDLQLWEITVTRQAIDSRYCYRKQQSLWLLTATSDIIKIQCFFWKILRYFNLFLHANQIAKYVVKRSIKSPQHVLD